MTFLPPIVGAFLTPGLLSRVNQSVRSHSDAGSLLGFSARLDGAAWTVDSFNDLGVLYWRRNDRAGLWTNPLADEIADNHLNRNEPI